MFKLGKFKRWWWGKRHLINCGYFFEQERDASAAVSLSGLATLVVDGDYQYAFNPTVSADHYKTEAAGERDERKRRLKVASQF